LSAQCQPKISSNLRPACYNEAGYTSLPKNQVEEKHP
jgi:hypothetical protein